jgi:hypothetical protein
MQDHSAWRGVSEQPHVHTVGVAVERRRVQRLGRFPRGA